MNGVYLGDSVYVDHTDGMLILTTNNGEGPSNTICLEPEVWELLLEFARKIGWKTEGEK